MDFPENTLLPFFSYGIFQPGEIAFLRLAEFVESINESFTAGSLKIRDGLTLLDPTSERLISGYLLRFKLETAGKAYYRIIELEPDKQYEWREVEVDRTSDERQMLLSVSILRMAVRTVSIVTKGVMTFFLRKLCKLSPIRLIDTETGNNIMQNRNI